MTVMTTLFIPARRIFKIEMPHNSGYGFGALGPSKTPKARMWETSIPPMTAGKDRHYLTI
jgi:hypothetical protein